MGKQEELTVHVRGGENFNVTIELKYKPSELEQTTVKKFIEDVKTKFCKQLDKGYYAEDLSENHLDENKLREFNILRLDVQWLGRGQGCGGVGFKPEGAELKLDGSTTQNKHTKPTTLWDLLNHRLWVNPQVSGGSAPPVDSNLEVNLKAEDNKFADGYYGTVEIRLKSK